MRPPLPPPRPRVPLLPQLPRLVERFLGNERAESLQQELRELVEDNRQQNTLLAIIAVSLTAIAGLLLCLVL